MDPAHRARRIPLGTPQQIRYDRRQVLLPIGILVRTRLVTGEPSYSSPRATNGPSADASSGSDGSKAARWWMTSCVVRAQRLVVHKQRLGRVSGLQGIAGEQMERLEPGRIDQVENTGHRSEESQIPVDLPSAHGRVILAELRFFGSSEVVDVVTVTHPAEGRP